MTGDERARILDTSRTLEQAFTPGPQWSNHAQDQAQDGSLPDGDFQRPQVEYAKAKKPP